MRAKNIKADATSLEYTAVTPVGEIRMRLNLPGGFNVYNSLAALTVGISQGVQLENAKKALEAVQGVSGRMEKIDEGQPFAVIVDYAHNPDSIEQVLKDSASHYARPPDNGLWQRGERDIAKRPIQGQYRREAGRFRHFHQRRPPPGGRKPDH